MKYLILGAGPAGLSLGNALLKKNKKDFLILEAENEAGGLCRTKTVDGAPLDIGGGHFLDTRRAKVNEFLFEFMPADEWNLFVRNSKIDVNGKYIDHPFEANIWQFDTDIQIEYLKSIAKAGCNTNKKMPVSFTEWIYWKLGNKIAEDYMIPYNKKMFGDSLDSLGTYWLEKLPNVSFEDTLRACLTRKSCGDQPGHTTFYYPKVHGYGELWNRMADNLGDKIYYNQRVVAINFLNNSVKTIDGNIYKADMIISTIPWMEFKEIVGMPDELKKSISLLKYTSVQIKYCNEILDTEAHWIYYPDSRLDYHRILLRHNFCPNSKGYWTETNVDRVKDVTDDGMYKYLNKYAYPLNTIDKPKVIGRLLNWSKGYNVYGLGRWGEHEHYNSDLTVELALNFSKNV